MLLNTSIKLFSHSHCHFSHALYKNWILEPDFLNYQEITFGYDADRFLLFFKLIAINAVNEMKTKKFKGNFYSHHEKGGWKKIWINKFLL